MKHFYSCIAIMFTMIAYAQDYNGYYITENNETVKGYFKEADFTDISAFEFKRNAKDVYEKLNMANIKELSIGNEFKLEKHTVKMDDTDYGKLNQNKEGNYTNRTIFLNVIIEGDATLYAYSDNKGTRFFYKVDSKNIEIAQLVYRKYRATASNGSIENPRFRQQIYANLNCKNKDVSEFSGIKYTKSELIKIFQEYNTCKNAGGNLYNNSVGKKSDIAITVFAALYNSKFGMETADFNTNTPSTTNFGLGVEAAYVFPSERFSLFVKLEYEKFENEAEYVYVLPSTTPTTIINKYGFDGSFINLYLGPRYNFVVSPKHKIHADIAIGIGFASGNIGFVRGASSTSTSYESGFYTAETALFFNYGIGYTFNNRLGIDFRMDTNRNVIPNYLNQKTVIGKFGVNLRYTFK